MSTSSITTDDGQSARLQNIIDAAALGTWEWNVQTGEVAFNPCWAEMLGYTLTELSPLSVDTWVSLVHPDDLARTNIALARHIRDETQLYQCDCRMRHKNGEWIWITTRGRVTSRMEDGTPRIVCGTHQDITQIKRVVSALQDSEHSYELVALGTPSALYDWDIPSDTITWRGKSYEVLGTAGNLDLPMRSVEFQNWVHPDDWARYRRTLRRYFKRDTQLLRDDLRLIRPDGTVIWVEYHGAALWEKGRARRMFGSFTDVSTYKRNEMLIKETARTLADILHRLGQDLAQDRRALQALALTLKPPF